MSSIVSRSAEDSRQRRRLTTAIKDALRDLRNQLSLLNHQVGARIELKDVDLDCLEIIGRHGPMSPSALARRAGLHPATVTGIVDRLQRGGWVARERDPDAADRRAVTIRALRDRSAEIFRLYAGMNSSMDEICAGYSNDELLLIADFLRRTASAGHDAAEELAER
jgi:DNA-binding MarR family transcriptional regulator